MTDVPPGLELVTTLRGHTGEIRRLAWAPDGLRVATPSSDQTVRIWDIASGEPLHTLDGHTDTVHAVAWSPDGRVLASGGRDGKIRLWEPSDNHVVSRRIASDSSWVNSVAWSADGTRLAAGSENGQIVMWDVRREIPSARWSVSVDHSVHAVAWSPDDVRLAAATGSGAITLLNLSGEVVRHLVGHRAAAFSLSWADDRRLASGGWDRTVRLWDAYTGAQVAILEGLFGRVASVSYSADGRLLAVKSHDDDVWIFRADTQEPVASFEEEPSGRNSASLAFHPRLPYLATLGDRDLSVRIWRVDTKALLRGVAPDHLQYRNAKVVLVGDTGVGKTGLARALTGQRYLDTGSTHGREVHTLARDSVQLDGGAEETREVLLWDTAGQPGYRLIHQLHLAEVAVALVVFDSRSETDPFAGVRYWRRALAQAQRLRGTEAAPPRVFLVAARIDRGAVGVSREQIDELVTDLGFDGFHETSAAEGIGISGLDAAIRAAVAWDTLPLVTSTLLMEQIRAFLLHRRDVQRVMATRYDLFADFRDQRDDHVDPQLEKQFETCVVLMQNNRLVRWLSFGDLVLLRPEKLDAYASSIVTAARNEPHGLGFITEDAVLSADFQLPSDEHVTPPQQERLLLSATAEELLNYEIAFKEVTEEGVALVFPAQFTRRRPEAPTFVPVVTFTFQGSPLSIYTTLAVRLSRSVAFRNDQMWQGAATFTATQGGTCGIVLREIDEGAAELGLFFDDGASPATQFQFEEYVAAHLRRRAVGTMTVVRAVMCPTGDYQYPQNVIDARRALRQTTLRCPICDSEIPMPPEDPARPVPPGALTAMDAAADEARERDTASTIVRGKRDAEDYDVFLSYNTQDRDRVVAIRDRLAEHRILAFVDYLDLSAGRAWQPELLARLGTFPAAAVFVGGHGIGSWQREEINTLTALAVDERSLVIPVYLDSAPAKPPSLGFLDNRTWVDFRRADPDPMARLVDAIKSARPQPDS